MNRQWIRTDGWRIEGRDHYKKSIPARVTIAFDIDNPTNTRLTIQEISATIAGTYWKSNIKNVLGPDDSAMKVELSVPIPPESYNAYRRKNFPIEVRGNIQFVDCFGKTQEQPFGQHCVLGMDFVMLSPLKIGADYQNTD